MQMYVLGCIERELTSRSHGQSSSGHSNTGVMSPQFPVVIVLRIISDRPGAWMPSDCTIFVSKFENNRTSSPRIPQGAPIFYYASRAVLWRQRIRRG